MHCLSVCMSALFQMLQTHFLGFDVSLQQKSRVKAAHTHVVSCTFPHTLSFGKGQKEYIHHVIPYWIIALTPDWLRLVCTQSELCLSHFFPVHLNVFPLMTMMMKNGMSNALTMFPGCLARFSFHLVCLYVYSVCIMCFPWYLFHRVFINHFYWKWKKK